MSHGGGLLLVSQTFFSSALISHLFPLGSSNTELAQTCTCSGLRFTCAARRPLAHGVAHVAVADEGALGVLAVAAQADVGVQLTLVHVWKQRERKNVTASKEEKNGTSCPDRCRRGYVISSNQAFTICLLELSGACGRS